MKKIFDTIMKIWLRDGIKRAEQLMRIIRENNTQERQPEGILSQKSVPAPSRNLNEYSDEGKQVKNHPSPEKLDRISSPTKASAPSPEEGSPRKQIRSSVSSIPDLPPPAYESDDESKVAN